MKITVLLTTDLTRTLLHMVNAHDVVGYKLQNLSPITATDNAKFKENAVGELFTQMEALRMVSTKCGRKFTEAHSGYHLIFNYSEKELAAMHCNSAAERMEYIIKDVERVLDTHLSPDLQYLMMVQYDKLMQEYSAHLCVNDVIVHTGAPVNYQEFADYAVSRNEQAVG